MPEIRGTKFGRHDGLVGAARGLALAALLALAPDALAEGYGRPTAILVQPIHEAQVVRGDDGMDHVEYELLVVSLLRAGHFV